MTSSKTRVGLDHVGSCELQDPLFNFNSYCNRNPLADFPQEKDKEKSVLFFWQRELALNMIIATLGTWLFPLGRSNVIKAELLFQS